jgi:hypothetical protein
MSTSTWCCGLDRFCTASDAGRHREQEGPGPAVITQSEQEMLSILRFKAKKAFGRLAKIMRELREGRRHHDESKEGDGGIRLGTPNTTAAPDNRGWYELLERGKQHDLLDDEGA